MSGNNYSEPTVTVRGLNSYVRQTDTDIGTMKKYGRMDETIRTLHVVPKSLWSEQNNRKYRGLSYRRTDEGGKSRPSFLGGALYIRKGRIGSDFFHRMCPGMRFLPEYRHFQRPGRKDCDRRATGPDLPESAGTGGK